MNRLMLHCGTNRVEYDAVQQVDTPPPTDTHFPLPHTLLVESTIDQLQDLGFTLGEQEHALWGDGIRYFGMIAIESGPGVVANNHQYVLGLRNAHDKSFSAQGLLGHDAFICDNLIWAGGSVFRFGRKHTRFIIRDLAGVIALELGKLATRITAMETRFAQYRGYRFGVNLDDEADGHDQWARLEASDFFVAAMRRRALAPSRALKVINEWYRDDGCGGHDHPDYTEPTAMRMMNCFTEVEKEHPSLLEGPRRNARLIGLLDGMVGIESEDMAEVE